MQNIKTSRLPSGEVKNDLLSGAQSSLRYYHCKSSLKEDFFVLNVCVSVHTVRGERMLYTIL